MNVTITGTRSGMSPAQRDWFCSFLAKTPPDVLIHGAARGVDSEAHHYAKISGVPIEIHPAHGVPSNVDSLAQGDVYSSVTQYGSAPPLVRNRTMVDRADLVIGFPHYEHEELRSGTWAAIRYARKRRKPLIIVYPSGDVDDNRL